MQSYSQSKSIPTFKLHRVIITILGRNVKFLFHFFSFFLSGGFDIGSLHHLQLMQPYWGNWRPFILGAGGEFWVCSGVGMVKKIFAGV